jgi:parallel beta-helix repeat protein
MNTQQSEFTRRRVSYLGFACFILALTLLLLSRKSPAVAHAASCNVLGFIGSNTTWSPASCDPYIVTGSIIVQAGVTLTIEPGTTVKFDNLKAMIVQGTLIAQGAEGNPITFTSNVGTSKGDWGYIYFANSSADATFDGSGNYVSGSILQYAIVEYAGGADVPNNGTLRIEASSPYIDHATVRNNNASGVYVWNDGAPRVANNTIVGNSASGVVGGGIYLSSSSASAIINNNTITGNSASDFGGGIFLNSSASATISNNTITGNSADVGGGIYLESSSASATISNNIITGNSASDSGGGIFLKSSSAFASASATISNNTITDNSADTGGGIFLNFSSHLGSATITNNIISGNFASRSRDDFASGAGGGIFLAAYGNTIVSNNTITGNSADTGGGIYVFSIDIYIITVNDNTVSNNTAAQINRGGGIYLNSSRLTVINNNDLYGNLTGSPAITPNDLYNQNIYGDIYGDIDVNAENNYWGTTDVGIIEDHVWHFIDDSSLGIVDYNPFRTAPVFDITPTPTPTNTPTPTFTFTPTSTPTHTPVTPNAPTHTSTPTHTPTHTPAPTFTFTPTSTPTHTSTVTPTHTPVTPNAPTHTPTPTPTSIFTSTQNVFLPRITR